MGSASSRLSRELVRNSTAVGYASALAQAPCQRRRINARPLPKLHADGALWCVVCDLLVVALAASANCPRTQTHVPA